MAKPGRPSSFDPKVAAQICERLAMDESLASICRDDGMPTVTTVYRWRAAHEQFGQDYARARTDQGHTVADFIGEIRRKIVDGEIDWQTGKAAADLAKWEASRRAARDYGDKLDLTSDGKSISLAAELDAARRRAAEGTGED